MRNHRGVDKADIVRLCQLDPGGRVFCLGMFDTKVTIYAQQLRGFNLAWALIESGHVPPGAELAVVGGGAAGLSAAVGLSSARDVRITLFEGLPHLMAMQHNNRNRFIQPNIYEWPDVPETLTVALPDLRWRSDVAGEIQRRILERFRQYETRIQVRHGRRLRSWQVEDGRAVLRFHDTQSPRRLFSERFDLAVLALGFGVERDLAGRRTLSYWNNDIMDQVGAGRYLIYGVGDGGLTDAMRIALLDLSHREILASFQYEGAAIDLGRRLEAEEAALATALAAGAIERTAHLDGHHRLYATLPPIERLCRLLADHRRPDTEVALTARGHMYAPNASILNKLIIRHLEAIGAVSWCAARDSEEAKKRMKCFYRVGARRLAPDPVKAPPPGFDAERGHELGSAASFPHEYFRLRYDIRQARLLVMSAHSGDAGRGGPNPHAQANAATLDCIRDRFDAWATREWGWRAQWLPKRFAPLPGSRTEILECLRDHRDEFDLLLVLGSDIGVPLWGDGGRAAVEETLAAAGGKPVVSFGAHPRFEPAALTVGALYFAEQIFDLERLRRIMQIALPDRDLWYLTDPRYLVDMHFFQVFDGLCQAGAATDPLHFRFRLMAVDEDSFSIDQLPEERIYVGRFFAHRVGHEHRAMRQRTFLSSYLEDLEIGAVVSVDSDPDHCASRIVNELIVPLFTSGEAPARAIAIPDQRITVHLGNAARRGLELNEAFLSFAAIVR
jgi:hypothetical protein